MSFQQTTKDDLLGLINISNAINPALKLTDVTWSTPQVVAGTWREQATTKNTAVRVTADPAGMFQGSVPQLYDRLPIAALANFAGFRILAPTTAVTVHDLLRSIEYGTGVRFSVDDLENTAITTEDGKRYAVLSAKPTSLGWLGNLRMEVQAGGVNLDTAVTQPLLPGLLYPDPTAVPGTDTFGAVYLYGYDFTSYVATLLDYAPGVVDLAQATFLMNMLKAVDVSVGKTLWNVTAASTSYGLLGATILSNGLNNDATKPTNPAYKYILALKLADTVTTPRGVMYLHYNDPFNPDEF
jgi:hypothetical protein